MGSIAELYNQIIQSTNETVREEHLNMLTMLKEVREQIDDHISNLLEEEEPEKIKKYVTSTMRGFIIDIGQKYKDCLEENCPDNGGPECESCGADKVDEMRDKMRVYKSNLDSQREKLKVINDCKGPMWMLVNTTIFDTLENVVAMVNAMDEQLKLKRGVYCEDGPVP